MLVEHVFNRARLLVKTWILNPFECSTLIGLVFERGEVRLLVDLLVLMLFRRGLLESDCLLVVVEIAIVSKSAFSFFDLLASFLKLLVVDPSGDTVRSLEEALEPLVVESPLEVLESSIMPDM